jgi:hypothetical protein
MSLWGQSVPSATSGRRFVPGAIGALLALVRSVPGSWPPQAASIARSRAEAPLRCDERLMRFYCDGVFSTSTGCPVHGHRASVTNRKDLANTDSGEPYARLPLPTILFAAQERLRAKRVLLSSRHSPLPSMSASILRLPSMVGCNIRRFRPPRKRLFLPPSPGATDKSVRGPVQGVGRRFFRRACS